MSICKTAIITGGNRGLGKAIVNILEERRCTVISTSTKELNFLDENSIDDFIHCNDFKNINILVNNAGIRVGTWEEIMHVNLLAPKIMMDASVKHMKRKSGGSIVNISSVAGMVSKQIPDAYASSKASLVALSREKAIEFAKDNILVNTVCPGPIETDMLNNNLSKKQQEKWKQTIPLGRFAKVDEVAKVVAFLCLDNTYITGQNIVVDGGFVIQ